MAYISGINKKCGEFSNMIDNTTSFEKVFWSLRAKALINYFKLYFGGPKIGKTSKY